MELILQLHGLFCMIRCTSDLIRTCTKRCFSDIFRLALVIECTFSFQNASEGELCALSVPQIYLHVCWQWRLKIPQKYSFCVRPDRLKLCDDFFMLQKHLGTLLQSVRQSKNVDLKTVASALKLKEKYLHAIETGEISRIEGVIYLRGCIKSYACWLGLDGDALLREYRVDYASERLLPVWRAFSVVSFLYRLPVLLPVRLYTVSLVLLCMVYAAWYVSQTAPDVEPLYNSQVYSIWVNDKLRSYEGKPFLFIARQDVVLTTYQGSDDAPEVYRIAKGTAQRVIYYSGLRIRVDHPDAVIVQLDDVQKTVLGTFVDVFNRVGGV